MDFVKALDTGLYLDTLDCIIKWSCTPDDLLNEIGEADYEMYKSDYMNCVGYNVQSGVFGIPRSFGVLFNFINEKLTSVNINELFSQDAILNFDRIQNELEPVLGKPHRLPYSFNSKKRSYKWKFKRVVIEHSIIERDGLQRMFEIRIK